MALLKLHGSSTIAVPSVYLWSGEAFTANRVAHWHDLVHLLTSDLVRPIEPTDNGYSFSLKIYGLIIEQKDLPDLNAQVNALVLSFVIRFSVYASQYVLLLIFFGGGTQIFQLAIHSVVFLLVQTFSPLMPLFDVSFRNSSALFVFKNFTTGNLAVLSAVTSVWLLNLALPAIAGYLFIFKRKWVAVISKCLRSA